MKKVLLYTILCISLVAMVSACSSQPGTQIAAPTMDVSIIRTEVVAAMQAAFTQEALSKPSQESTIAVTQTPYVITATFEPATATPQVVASLTPTKKTYVIATVAAPTKIPGPARLTSQSPYDNTKFSPGTSFDAVFTIQNNSTKNWTKGYYIRYVGGDLVPDQKQVMISDLVDIGRSTTFTVDYVAPGEGGKHTSNWEFVDDNGAAILSFYLIINVE